MRSEDEGRLEDRGGHRVTLVGAGKSYGAVRALAEVDLQVEAGTFLVLLGPSGSGKTTLVRSLAGIERLDAGEIHIGERLVSAGRTHERGLARPGRPEQNQETPGLHLQIHRIERPHLPVPLPRADQPDLVPTAVRQGTAGRRRTPTINLQPAANPIRLSAHR